MRFTLSARPPFSLTTVVRSHGWVRLAPFSEDESTAGLTYIDRLDVGARVGDSRPRGSRRRQRRG